MRTLMTSSTVKLIVKGFRVKNGGCKIKGEERRVMCFWVVTILYRGLLWNCGQWQNIGPLLTVAPMFCFIVFQMTGFATWSQQSNR